MAISRCNRAGARLMLGIALLLASWAALTPNPMPLPDGPQMDKLAHLLTYVVLALLADFSWPDRGFDLPKWSALLSYGILIELIQSQVPNRMFSLADLVANAAGIALYAFLFARILRAKGLR